MYFLTWKTPALTAVTCDVSGLLGRAGVTELAVTVHDRK